MRSVRPALFTLALAAALVAAGCSVFGRGGGPRAQSPSTASITPAAADAEQIDLRRYLGPGYCPEMRILDGAELLRRYESGRDGDPASVIWQASFSKTARECLYDPNGGLAVKLGLAGRVISGPKGTPGEVAVPLKVAIVKYKEAIVTQEALTLNVAIPPAGSTTFTEVREISVPPLSGSKDYIIYVGFDVGGWDPMNPGAVATAAVEAPVAPVALPQEIYEDPEPAPAEPPPPPKKQEPNVLPTPSGGFVLPR